MRHHSRPGYGLFQLLVLLALLIMLAGLLLPALMKVRGAAGRTQSANNLRNIGVATHDYITAYDSELPTGVNAKNFSALFHLLPYIEQQQVYNQADTKKDVDDKANAKVRATRIKTFESPLDPLIDKLPPGGTNYFAMAGSKMSLKNNDGVFFRDSKVPILTITDGTTNTILFVEMLRGDGGKKATDVQRQHVRLKAAALKNLKETSGVKDFEDDKNIAADRGSSWMDGRFLRATMNATLGMLDKRPDVDCGGEGGLSGIRTVGKTLVGFADGTVRTAPDNVTLDGWKAAATKDAADTNPTW